MFAKTFLALAALAAASPALASNASDCLEIGAARETAYVVANGDDSTICGDLGDIDPMAEKHRKGEEAVWFRLDEATWVVRDPAVVAEARALFVKVHEIGGKQGEIGAKQGAIGAEQGRLGIKTAEVALRSLGDGAPTANEAREADARSARMRELGKEMEGLGTQQSALAQEMTREIATAQAGLSRLLEKAMRDGTAVRVRRL